MNVLSVYLFNVLMNDEYMMEKNRGAPPPQFWSIHKCSFGEDIKIIFFKQFIWITSFTVKCTLHLITHQVRLDRRWRPRGVMGVAQMIDELDFRLEQRSRQARAVVAAEHAVFAAVIHAKVNFER